MGVNDHIQSVAGLLRYIFQLPFLTDCGRYGRALTPLVALVQPLLTCNQIERAPVRGPVNDLHRIRLCRSSHLLDSCNQLGRLLAFHQPPRLLGAYRQRVLPLPH